MSAELFEDWVRELDRKFGSDKRKIRALKAKYCSRAVCRLMSALEKTEPMPTISILSAIIKLTKSRHVLPNKTFTNGFKVAGISENEVGRMCDEEGDLFSSLDDIDEDTVQTVTADLAVFKEKFGDQVDLNITLDELIDFDSDVATYYSWKTIKSANPC